MSLPVINRNLLWCMAHAADACAFKRAMGIHHMRMDRIRRGALQLNAAQVLDLQRLSGIGADVLLTVDLSALSTAAQAHLVQGAAPPRWIVHQQQQQAAA